MTELESLRLQHRCALRWARLHRVVPAGSVGRSVLALSVAADIRREIATAKAAA